MAIRVKKEYDFDVYYAVKCNYCGCEFEYQKEDLGYRPWYPSGFVYCPHCHRPLRHKKEYLVKKEPEEETTTVEPEDYQD